MTVTYYKSNSKNRYISYVGKNAEFVSLKPVDKQKVNIEV